MKRTLKKWLPSAEELSERTSIGWIKRLLNAGYLWHLHRRTVAGGVAVGLFINFVPVPGQLLWTILFSCVFRVNLPIALIMTCINNPFTFVPINLFIYKLGNWVLGTKAAMNQVVLPKFTWSFEGISAFIPTFMQWLSSLGKAYFVGLPIVCVVSSVVGYFLVQCGWRISVNVQWRRRHAHR